MINSKILVGTYYWSEGVLPIEMKNKIPSYSSTMMHQWLTSVITIGTLAFFWRSCVFCMTSLAVTSSKLKKLLFELLLFNSGYALATVVLSLAGWCNITYFLKQASRFRTLSFTEVVTLSCISCHLLKVLWLCAPTLLITSRLIVKLTI